MNCNGKELKEITEPQVFIPPKKMYVIDELDDEPKEAYVVAIIENGSNYRVIVEREIGRFDGYQKCFEIPEEPKPRRSTNRELAKWLAQGNGEVLTLMQMTNRHSCEIVASTWHYFCGEDNKAVDYGYDGNRCKGIRKWEDTEWHEPTVDYMELEVVCRK